MLSPKAGARSLLPTSSRAITTAPETKTVNLILQMEICPFVMRGSTILSAN